MKKRAMAIFVALVMCLASGCGGTSVDFISATGGIIAKMQANSFSGSLLITVADEGKTPTNKEIPLEYASKSGYARLDDVKLLNVINSALMKMNDSGKTPYQRGDNGDDKYTLSAVNFANNAGKSIIENMDKPLAAVINDVLGFYRGEKFDILDAVSSLKLAVTDSATVNEVLAALERAVKPLGLDAKTIVNAFVGMNKFLAADGYPIAGVTIRDTPYETLVSSFGKLKFLTVLGALQGKLTPVTPLEFAAIIDAAAEKITKKTSEWLNELTGKSIEQLESVTKPPLQGHVELLFSQLYITLTVKNTEVLPVFDMNIAVIGQLKALGSVLLDINKNIIVKFAPVIKVMHNAQCSIFNAQCSMRNAQLWIWSAIRERVVK